LYYFHNKIKNLKNPKNPKKNKKPTGLVFFYINPGFSNPACRDVWCASPARFCLTRMRWCGRPRQGRSGASSGSDFLCFGTLIQGSSIYALVRPVPFPLFGLCNHIKRGFFEYGILCFLPISIFINMILRRKKVIMA